MSISSEGPHLVFSRSEAPFVPDLEKTGFRFVRAVELWKSNADLTLTAIIVRTIEKGGSLPP